MEVLSRREIIEKEPLIIGYGNWGQCNDKMIGAVENGVNVIIWFSLNLIQNPKTFKIQIDDRDFDYDCVAKIMKSITEKNFNVVHLMSIGGWNSPHISTEFTAEKWWEELKNWNRKISRPNLGFNGFDGFDWDLEGNDDVKSEYNKFTVAELDLMGRISQLAKKDGYIVSMAPSQSYLDVETSEFTLSLLHSPSWHDNFPYHSKNVMAYVLAKYSTTNKDSQNVPTFDFISLQIYEGWSRALHETKELKVPIDEYLYKLVKKMNQGWKVNFTQENVGLDDTIVSVANTKLVIGLANGWAYHNEEGKFLLLYPEDLEKAYKRLKDESIEPRGFMFWNIEDEGRMVKRGGKEFPMYLAKGLKIFL